MQRSTSLLPRGAAAVVLCMACIATSGCGDRGPRRYRVSGSVSHAGKPVQIGRIVFEPDAARGNSGPQGFAPIENGRFDTAAPHCKGGVSGPTVVRIDGMETTGGEDAAASGRMLFPTHEERIELPAEDTVRDFAVPASHGQ